MLVLVGIIRRSKARQWRRPWRNVKRTLTQDAYWYWLAQLSENPIVFADRVWRAPKLERIAREEIERGQWILLNERIAADALHDFISER